MSRSNILQNLKRFVGADSEPPQIQILLGVALNLLLTVFLTLQKMHFFELL